MNLPFLLAGLLTRLASNCDEAVPVPRDLFLDLIDVVAAASNAQLRVDRTEGEGLGE